MIFVQFCKFRRGFHPSSLSKSWQQFIAGNSRIIIQSKMSRSKYFGNTKVVAWFQKLPIDVLVYETKLTFHFIAQTTVWLCGGKTASGSRTVIAFTGHQIVTSYSGMLMFCNELTNHSKNFQLKSVLVSRRFTEARWGQKKVAQKVCCSKHEL